MEEKQANEKKNIDEKGAKEADQKSRRRRIVEEMN